MLRRARSSSASRLKPQLRAQRARTAEQCYKEHLEAKLSAALATISEIPHACVLVSAGSFEQLGALRSHEEVAP